MKHPFDSEQDARDVPNETELVDVSHIRYVDMKEWPTIEEQKAYWKDKDENKH